MHSSWKSAFKHFIKSYCITVERIKPWKTEIVNYIYSDLTSQKLWFGNDMVISKDIENNESLSLNCFQY